MAATYGAEYGYTHTFVSFNNSIKTTSSSPEEHLLESAVTRVLETGSGVNPSEEAGSSIAKALVVSIVTSLLTLACILGNSLVISAVALVHKLKTPCNYLIVSLAVSDILVGLVVMPLAIVYEVNGRWLFGETACVIWVTFDVTLSTASILNLVMISVDRYLVISQPFKYSRHRTGKLMLVYISVAWTVSLLISTTPLFVNWLPVLTEDKWCMVNQKLEYQMYATFGAFYLPLGIMITLYGRIFHITLRFRKADAKNNPQPMNAEEEDLNDETHMSSNDSETSSEKLPISNNNNSPKSVLASPSGRTRAVDRYLSIPVDHAHMAAGANGQPRRKPSLLCSPHHTHLHPDHPHHGDHRRSSGALKRFSVATIASIRKVLTRHTHKRNSQAVRTLGVIMGLFIVCWLPFFILAVIAPICETYAKPNTCQIPRVVWGVLVWLGYVNSCLNPLIYACFNREFRIPFKEMLCCRCRKINEVVRHDDYVTQYGEET